MLLGKKNDIIKGMRYRKLFGGGMRQSGYPAAAAEFAVDNHIERLSDDHANAKQFATGVNDLSGLNVIMESVHTNIVMIDVDESRGSAFDLVDKLLMLGLGVLPVDEHRIRAVFHLHISAEDTVKAINLFRDTRK